MLRIVIIGGGITGAAAAAELARTGQAVTLISRSDVFRGTIFRLTGWLVSRAAPPRRPNPLCTDNGCFLSILRITDYNRVTYWGTDQ